MSATNRGAVRKPNDFYPTPVSAIEPFLRVWQPRTNATWLEPCAGEGVIIRTIQNYDPQADFTAVEIRPDAPKMQLIGVSNITWNASTDFLEWDSPYSYDYCLTNPPFELAMPFIQKCLTLCDEVAMLLRLNFLGSKKRAAFHKEYPSKVHVLPTRPSFDLFGRTDSCEYAWFLWNEETMKNGGSWCILDP